MDLVQAIIIAIVEGLTEFLPISSTAHMGFAANLMGMQESEFLKMFQVSIQFGAILAVVIAYWKKFFDSSHFQFYRELSTVLMRCIRTAGLF
jgi:undecaprenyl-diphosphatase